MSRKYKNIIKLRNTAYGTERRRNLAKEIVKDSTPLPKPLGYEDIDKEFNRWVKEDLYVVFEGEELPTFALFSNQRFSEFLQSWNEVDDKKNLILNFKTVTRENNPKPGTIVGNTRNIPGERYMLMKRVEAYDKNNRKYFIDYKVKQPIAVDFVYTIGIVTNKYELLNKFNILINDKFKSINCYIRPNDHFIPMKLNDISDESEYNIDNRTYYAQNYSITVMAYIMPEDSFVVEEKPNIKLLGFENDRRKTFTEIEELPSCPGKEQEKEYEYVPINIKVHFDVCASKYQFTIDTHFHAKTIKMENIRHVNVYVNDKEVVLDENFELKINDTVRFSGLVRYKNFEDSEIIIEGFDYREIYKVNEEEVSKTIILE